MSQPEVVVAKRPLESPLVRFFHRYMFFTGIAGNGIFYVQAYDVFRTQSARDVSLLGFSISLWAVSSWLIYGLLLKNKVIAIANIVAVIGASLVIVGKLMYG